MSGTTIDDADPGVVYSANWAAYSGRSTSYRGTIHESSALNDRATFSFQGVGVLVNSGQPGIGWRVRSSYAIDGGSPTVYSNDSYQSTMEAYRSPTLPNGRHTLTVTNLDNRASLFLDFFLVLTSDDPGDPVPMSSPSESTSTLTSASASVGSTSNSNSNIPHSGTTTTSTTSTSPTNSGFLPVTPPRSSTSSIPNVGPTPTPSSVTKSEARGQIPLIVGPISGAILICGFIVLYVLLRRRRKQNLEPDPLFTPAAFNSPIRFQTAMREDGQKPSTFIHDSNEPPPYVEDSQSSSSSSTPNRHPAKFSA